MGEIYIHYGNLEDSVSKSKKVRDEITTYVDEIQKRITSPIFNLSGSDSAGYISTASSLAWTKIGALKNKSSRFSSYESAINNMISVAKQKDNYVSSQIETIAGMYIQERKWYQKAGDWIYNTFCVDLANKWGWTRAFSDAVKWVGDKVGNGFEAVVDWFKYGDGKYVWNVISSVVGSVVAIGSAIVAICSIPFTGGATIPIVIGCISAAAASVGAIITTVNSVTSVVQNSRALAKSGNPFDDDDGNPSAARYYGSQTTLSAYFNKTDMGDKEANEAFEKTGQVVDTIKVTADVTSFVCSVANLGVVRDYRVKNGPNVNTRYNGDKWYKGYSFTYDNIKRNIMHEMGYKISSGKLDLKEAFDPRDNIFAKNYTQKKFTLTWKHGTWSLSEKAVNFFRGAKIADNVLDIGENAVTLNDYFTYRDTAPTVEDAAGAVEAATGLFSNMSFYEPFDDFGTKTGKRISDILELHTGKES